MNNYAYQSQKPQKSLHNNSAYEQQLQVQSLKLTQKQQEEVKLIRFYIYENFQFLINLISSLKAVNEHFINDPQHPMKIIARNKIVLQLNLSNCIQYDQQYQYQSDSKLNQILQQEKQNAQQLLEQLSPELKEEFKNYFDIYKTNSLNQNIQICSQNLEQTNLDAKFNQDVLQSIISSIQSVDQTTKEFREQKIYNKPNIQDVFEKSQNYYEKTKQQLNINFPNPINERQQSKFEEEKQNAQALESKTSQNLTEKVTLHSSKQIHKKSKQRINQKYHSIKKNIKKK
ncbi:unnamed protein product [Paramecium sonneborni]|uniref:Uncharacterized protein n=1 Tax=Paramecium sonneborni TaxID=65129 RepID=A0A8S1MTN4_9CILI|nr:unnamed protein product [Paramecium sonneborni]